MTKQEVINYIIETPGNTNPAVLSSILNEFGASDNKQEIELSATENKVYTPAEGKVYNKVTVNVPVGNNNIEILNLVPFEDGSGGYTSNQRKIDKTYGEINTLYTADKSIFLKDEENSLYGLNSFSCDETNGYYISFNNLGWNFISGEGPNDYPIEDME